LKNKALLTTDRKVAAASTAAFEFSDGEAEADADADAEAGAEAEAEAEAAADLGSSPQSPGMWTPRQLSPALPPRPAVPPSKGGAVTGTTEWEYGIQAKIQNPWVLDSPDREHEREQASHTLPFASSADLRAPLSQVPLSHTNTTPVTIDGLSPPRAYNPEYPHPLSVYASPAVNPAAVARSGYAPLLADLIESDERALKGSILADCGKDVTAPALMLDSHPDSREGCGIPEKYWLKLSQWAAVKVPLGAVVPAVRSRGHSLDQGARTEKVIPKALSIGPRRSDYSV
jgi:hypothetical protein